MEAWARSEKGYLLSARRVEIETGLTLSTVTVPADSPEEHLSRMDEVAGQFSP